MNSQVSDVHELPDLNPTEARFLKRLKEDWASLEAMKKLVKGGCEPGTIYSLLCAYLFEPEVKALDEYLAAARNMKAIFERLHKHLSGACEEVAKMREIPEYPDVHTLFLPIERFRDDVKALIPQFGKSADKRGSVRKEVWLTAVLLYVEQHLKQPCFPQITQLIDAIAVADGKQSELTEEAIRKIYDRYRQKGEVNIQLSEGALRMMLTVPSSLGTHIRQLLREVGRQES